MKWLPILVLLAVTAGAIKLSSIVSERRWPITATVSAPPEPGDYWVLPAAVREPVARPAVRRVAQVDRVVVASPGYELPPLPYAEWVRPKTLSVADTIRRDFPAGHVDTALCVAGYESNFDPDAVNPADPKYPSVGVFQVQVDNFLGRNFISYLGDEPWAGMPLTRENIEALMRALRDHNYNISIAVEMVLNDGWRGHWAAQRGRCW